MKKTLLKTAVCLMAAIVAPTALAAEKFPERPVTLIVPNSPGGAVDILARLLSDKLQKIWEKPVVIIYKSGAGTVLGTDYVAKAHKDGYTLGMVVTSHVINPSLRSKLPYDTEKDLAGVSLLASSQIIITASPELGAKTLPEVIALAKKKPGELTYASPGSGSSMHLGGELLKSEAGIQMLHIPFKGSGPAYPEVMSGRVSLLIDPLFSSLPHIKSGRLVPIALMRNVRDPSVPGVGTVGDVLKGFDVQSIFGVVAPRGTPQPIIDKISADFAKVLSTPEMKERLDQIGMAPIGSTAQEFDSYIHTEIKKWATVVKTSGATAD